MECVCSGFQLLIWIELLPTYGVCLSQAVVVCSLFLCGLDEHDIRQLPWLRGPLLSPKLPPLDLVAQEELTPSCHSFAPLALVSDRSRAGASKNPLFVLAPRLPLRGTVQ